MAPALELEGFLLAFARTGAWATSAPLIGDGAVPPRVRAYVAATVAVPLAAVTAPALETELFARLPLEVIIGLALGFTSRLGLAAAEAGGQLLGMQLGLGFAGGFDPLAREESLPTRRLAFALAASSFIAAGGLERTVHALCSARADHILAAPGITSLLELADHVLLSGLMLAGPLVVAGVAANLTMAFASRAAPSLNVFSVMLALFLAVGLLVLLTTAPAFVSSLEMIAERAASAPETLWP